MINYLFVIFKNVQVHIFHLEKRELRYNNVYMINYLFVIFKNVSVLLV
jgi:hypothetical protein